MNSRELLYEVWAPAASPWSPWAKPVLFSLLPVIPAAGETPAAVVTTGWAPPADGTTALVLNLPGQDGVAASLALADRGYRPVPLYNAVPPPASGPGAAAVDVLSVARALQAGTDRLGGRPLPDLAPPAFLLDRNRGGAGQAPPPNWFDNRSVCFTTDLPSGAFLRSRGIQRVVLVQPDPDVARDLAHVLHRWQDAGLTLELLVSGRDESPQPLRVTKPSWFGFAFARVLLALGLRTHPHGGFGGWVPEPGSSSG